MERILSQDEIDNLIRHARGQKVDATQDGNRNVKPCAFRQGQLGQEQVRAISAVHETFTHRLTQSLGALLRIPFETKLVSVEELAYSEFLERIPQLAYFVSLQSSPAKGSAALQMDPSLVFPLIDILLSGTGHCEVPAREISEIEEHVLEGASRMICKELSTIWAPLGTTVDLDGRQSGSRIQTFLPATDRVLCISFELTLNETRGNVNLVCSPALWNPLFRRLSIRLTTPGAAKQTNSALKDKLMDCSFRISLRVTSPPYPLEGIVSLSPGSIVNLGLPVKQTPSLFIEDRKLCDALPVQQASHRAAQIVAAPAANLPIGQGGQA